MAKGRRPAGALETEVLAALWAAAEPMTPAQVQESLSAGLAYTTVMTILTRLHEKGAVSRERAGRAYAYAAVLDQSGIAAAQMRALLDRGEDRTAVLARFVDGLSGDDERALVELVQRAGRQQPAAGAGGAGTGHRAAGRSSAGRSDAGRPEAGRPGAGRSGAGKPGAGESGR